MKNSKKMISLALCLALMASMFVCLGTLTASAATESTGYRSLDWNATMWYAGIKITDSDFEGIGTQADPYIIKNAVQLRHIARGGDATSGKYYKLGNDIVLNDTSAEDWYLRSGLKNWIKGSNADGVFSDAMNRREMGGELFKGYIDGDGHTVSGLYVDYNGTGKMADRTIANWALFPAVNGATIKNLKLKDVYIKSNVSSNNNENHAYGALVGASYSDGVTVENVEIENVKFNINRPNQQSTSAWVYVGGIFGYSAGDVTVTDCIVKNVTAYLGLYYVSTRMHGYVGGLFGFIDTGKNYNLTNVFSIGQIYPFSAWGDANQTPAVTYQSKDTPSTFNKSNYPSSKSTNTYAIGAGFVHATAHPITAVANESAFLANNLDNFYNNLGTSTNWSEKNANELPYLKAFPPVEEHKTPAATMICDFSNYKVDSTSNLDPEKGNWSIVTESGNQVLCGDFTNPDLKAFNFGFNIVDNSVAEYDWNTWGPLTRGSIYKIEFRAKAEKNAGMNYSVYNANSYGLDHNSRSSHLNDDGSCDDYGKQSAALSTEWQTYSAYFTFDHLLGDVSICRPHFYIHASNEIWKNKIYLDDFVITRYDGVSFYVDYNHYLEPCVGEVGDDITLVADPEKENYIFEGWYKDSTLETPFEGTEKIGEVPMLYAKFEEAATETGFDEVSVTETGKGIYTENLCTKVTSANAYPINLDLANSGDGNVTLGFATASEESFDVANSVIWQKDITGKSGKVAVCLNPNTLKENGIKGDTLYLFVKYEDGADISITGFEMIDAPKSRSVENDVNSDNQANILDLIKLKKVAVGQADDINWLADINDDGFAAQAADLVVLRRALLGISDVVTEKMGRTLVWNEEFNGTSLNDSKFVHKYPSNGIASLASENFNVSDGKLNMNVTRVNGTSYKVPYEVMTKGSMSFNKGYIEMSAKMNLSSGQWAAFWLSAFLDKNTDDERKGEIDIFETYNNIKPNVHSWSSDSERLAHLGDDVPPYEIDENFDTTAYHTYGFEWDAAYLKFYIDGICYYTVATSSFGEEYDGIFAQEYFLILTNSIHVADDFTIGTDDALPRMSIDYVRLYQKDGETITVAQ